MPFWICIVQKKNLILKSNDVFNSFSKRQSCSFTEKGYCFKGELCPYDHGSDAIAVEDVDLSTGADENDDGVAKNEAENKASIVKLIQPAIQVQQPAAMSLHQSIISIPPPLLPRHPPMSMPPQHIMRNFPPPMNVNIPPPRILPPQSCKFSHLVFM